MPEITGAEKVETTGCMYVCTYVHVSICQFVTLNMNMKHKRTLKKNLSSVK